MAYATLTDLKLRLGSNTTPPGLYEQLTDRVDLTTANDAVGQEILDAAHGEINGYLARRYVVPVDVTADATLAQQLKGVALAIATKVAWENSPGRFTLPRKFTEAMSGYNQAILWLKDVAAGKVILPAVAAPAAATAEGASATAVGHAQVFTEEAMEGL